MHGFLLEAWGRHHCHPALPAAQGGLSQAHNCATEEPCAAAVSDAQTKLRMRFQQKPRGSQGPWSKEIRAPGIPEEEGQGHLACLITFNAAPSSPHGESEAQAHQQGPRATPWSCPLVFHDWKGEGDKDKAGGEDAETGALRHCWL